MNKPIQLDSKQKEFAESFTGPDGAKVLIGMESPAGVGKTQAMIGRFLHLCEKGREDRILMMTFTNLARLSAEQRILKYRPELKDRIPDTGELPSPGSPEPLWIGTFHAAAARILRLHMPWLGGRAAPLQILDERESRQIMTEIMHELPDEFPGAAYANNLNRELGRFQEILHSPQEHPAKAAYRERMIRENALDFDGIMQETAALFRNHPRVRQAWENAFDHVLVDEYQDTDPVQTEILETLSKNASLAVAGDAAQSIYGWRNAVGSLRALDGLAKKQNRKWQFIHLEKDYRLTQEIQAAAEMMAAEISLLKGHPHHKALPSSKPGPAPMLTIHEPGALHGLLESRLRKHHEKHGAWKGAAVLCRTNREVADAAGELGTKGIPVRLARRDEEVPAIALAQAWWQLLLHPSSDAAFRSIARNLGIQAAELAPHAQRAAAENVPVWEVIPPGEGELEQAAMRARRTYRYYNGYDSVHDNENTGSPAADPSLHKFFELTGCGLVFLQQAGQQTFESKLCESYRKSCEGIASRKRNIFDTASVLTAAAGRLQTHEAMEEDDFVEIRTIHSAKGLEYELVLSPNWTEESFPRGSDPESLEAAMKLAYVAITRACHRFEAFSPVRTEYGSALTPSRFAEIMHLKVQQAA